MVTAADIRAARARLDETQEQFSLRFGVDRSTIAKWEDFGPPWQGTARLLIERVLADLVKPSPENLTTDAPVANEGQS